MTAVARNTGHGQVAGYCCPCHCRSGAESAQDSVRSFAAAYVFGGCFCATVERCNCSVDIKYLSINDFAFLSALFASGNTGIT